MNGINQIISASNTVGTINQSTTTAWAAGVDTTGGPFTLDMIDRKLHESRSKNRSKVDLLALSWSSSTDIFGKCKAAIAPAQMLTVPENLARYGFVDFMYSGIPCFLDNSAPVPQILGIASETFYLGGDVEPTKWPVQRLPYTSLNEFFFTVWMGFGCGDPGPNFRITNVQ
jgi:hypothetical protein